MWFFLIKLKRDIRQAQIYPQTWNVNHLYPPSEFIIQKGKATKIESIDWRLASTIKTTFRGVKTVSLPWGGGVEDKVGESARASLPTTASLAKGWSEEGLGKGMMEGNRDKFGIRHEMQVMRTGRWWWRLLDCRNHSPNFVTRILNLLSMNVSPFQKNIYITSGLTNFTVRCLMRRWPLYGHEDCH